jgi:hypothetical protein
MERTNPWCLLLIANPLAVRVQPWNLIVDRQTEGEGEGEGERERERCLGLSSKERRLMKCNGGEVLYILW